MSARTIEAARIVGAQKCLEALRKLEQACISDSRDTDAEYETRRLSDARAFVAALGPMTPEQEGAVAVLVEHVHSDINGGAPSLGGWRPLSAMTEAEFLVLIGQLDAEHAAEQRQKASRKVVSIADRMPAR